MSRIWRQDTMVYHMNYQPLYHMVRDMGFHGPWGYDSAMFKVTRRTLRNILELICNEPVESKLRLYHGLNGDVRQWRTGSDNVLGKTQHMYSYRGGFGIVQQRQHTSTSQEEPIDISIG